MPSKQCQQLGNFNNKKKRNALNLSQHKPLFFFSFSQKMPFFYQVIFSIYISKGYSIDA